MSTTRIVHEQDAIQWLADHKLPHDAAIVTSLPNVDELSHRDFDRWVTWFTDTAELILTKTSPQCATVFFQTDIQHGGRWIDKSHMIQQAAARTDAHLIWHKIALRAPAGTTTNKRPGYAHILCFSQNLLQTPDNATPDVIPQLGNMAWPRAMGEDVATFVITWLRDHAGAKSIVAPFCGTGTSLAVANQLGLDAIGIERSTARAEKARQR